jgi:hypothetical protein
LAPENATRKNGPDSLPFDSNLRAANGTTLNMPTNDGTEQPFDTGAINLRSDTAAVRPL